MYSRGYYTQTGGSGLGNQWELQVQSSLLIHSPTVSNRASPSWGGCSSFDRWFSEAQSGLLVLVGALEKYQDMPQFGRQLKQDTLGNLGAHFEVYMDFLSAKLH